jgi:ribosomal protein S6--L-glutamate ligase
MHPLLHVGLFVERRYLSQRQPRALAATLRSRGHAVTIVDPEATTARLDAGDALEEFDVVVARGRSWGVLTLLALAEARGVPTVNRRQAVAAVHNKAQMAVALAAAGIATPPTYVGSLAALAASANDRAFPMVLKPMFGDNGAGLRIVRSASELTSAPWPEPSALAQTIVHGRGDEVKLYGVGSRVWAVRRRAFFAPGSADGTPMPAAEPWTPTPDYLAIARRCADLFGLDAYGVDCIDAADGPVVIEVNEFPNYTAIDEASGHLADCVIGRARERAAARRTSCVSGS